MVGGVEVRGSCGEKCSIDSNSIKYFFYKNQSFLDFVLLNLTAVSNLSSRNSTGLMPLS